jgi:hypothetical protein
LPEVYYSLDIAEYLCYGKDLLKSGSFFYWRKCFGV